jgi:hypothetical protein
MSRSSGGELYDPAKLTHACRKWRERFERRTHCVHCRGDLIVRPFGYRGEFLSVSIYPLVDRITFQHEPGMSRADAARECVIDLR